MDPYVRTYQPAYDEAGRVIQMVPPFNLALEEFLFRDEAGDKIPNTKGEWVFVYPNRVRQKLDMDLFI